MNGGGGGNRRSPQRRQDNLFRISSANYRIHESNLLQGLSEGTAGQGGFIFDFSVQRSAAGGVHPGEGVYPDGE